MVAVPYVKAGVVLASAAMIAAVPAIAPPLTPRDQRVIAATQAQLTASSTDLINIYFGVDPGDWPGFDGDNASNTGITGVIYRLLWDATADNESAQEYVSEYFNNGATGVTEKLLLEVAPPEAADYIQAFFGDGPQSTDDPGTTGIQGVIYQALYDAADGNAGAQALLETFFNDGFVGLSELALLAVAPSGLDPVISAYFAGGATQVVGDALVDAAPDDLDPYIQRYFKLAPYDDSDAYGPGETGAAGVILQLLNQVGPAETDELFDAYFAGGAVALTQTIINNNIDPDSVQGQLINEFIDNGVDGVVRYILAGPAPDESPEPTLLRTGNLLSLNSVEEKQGEELKGDTDPVDTLSSSVETTPPAGDTPPADPAAPTLLKKKFTINKDKALGTEALETGNAGATDPEVLLPGAGAPKPLNFNNWKKIADGINSFVKPKDAAPSAPSDDTTPKDKKADAGE